MPDHPERLSAGWRDIGAGFFLAGTILLGMVAFGDAGTDVDPHLLRAAAPPVADEWLSDDEATGPGAPRVYRVVSPDAGYRHYCQNGTPTLVGAPPSDYPRS
ncbi:hypothetical protein [Ancylobacter oerskovii]|uniref:Uncharacterized protein n=1 Tax=Ancylobacter oerskovii TaxID=459519 RepID=A0ABW4Z417_9HYPH|nr:hypothetical protein [Ancylobacter oerskovii]MBS7546177.1 hypothetical protein [Ancylobacter oerskovii]